MVVGEGEKQPVFFDDPDAPMFYASYLAGAAFDGPNVILTFCSRRVDHSKSPGNTTNAVVARLVIPIDQARDMNKFLSGFLPVAELAALEKPEGSQVQ